MLVKSLHYNVCLVFCQLKFDICVRCDMAFIEPMHRNKPNITYLLTCKITDHATIHYAENVSIWWRHHGQYHSCSCAGNNTLQSTIAVYCSHTIGPLYKVVVYNTILYSALWWLRYNIWNKLEQCAHENFGNPHGIYLCEWPYSQWIKYPTHSKFT